MSNLPDWYGVVKGVKFKSNGPVDDPGLIYKGLTFNYWDIEGVMYEYFKEYLKEQYPDDEYLEQIEYDVTTEDYHFCEWLENNNETVTNYLDDVIHGGYFG